MVWLGRLVNSPTETCLIWEPGSSVVAVLGDEKRIAVVRAGPTPLVSRKILFRVSFVCANGIQNGALTVLGPFLLLSSQQPIPRFPELLADCQKDRCTWFLFSAF